MSQTVIIIGIGEMGGVFARAFLKSGFVVQPVNRGDDVAAIAEAIPSPALVLLAVGEKTLDQNLLEMPESWNDRLVLLQNELLPADWQKHQLNAATVISVWFEKKQPMDFKVIVPSPVYGPQAQVVADALASINIAATVLADEASLLFELVRKNLYILCSNICGLQVGGNVGQLWQQHQDFLQSIANDVLAIQSHLCGKSLDTEPLMQAMKLAFDGDPDHQCMGRSAPARLQRALETADQAGIDVPALKAIKP